MVFGGSYDLILSLPFEFEGCYLAPSRGIRVTTGHLPPPTK